MMMVEGGKVLFSNRAESRVHILRSMKSLFISSDQALPLLLSLSHRRSPSDRMANRKPSTVPPTSTHESYHPGGYGVSQGLQRARRPFFVKNIITGGAIMSFAVGVYWYSIAKVGALHHNATTGSLTHQLTSSLLSGSPRRLQ